MSDENAATQEVQPTAAEWESWGPEGREKYLETHPGFTPATPVAQPLATNGPVEPVAAATPLTPASQVEPVAGNATTLEPVEVQPAVPQKLIGSPESGMQRLQAAINLLSTHSAAPVPGSIIGDAILLLQDALSILLEHHKPAA